MAWRIVDSVAASPGSEDVGVSWLVRLQADTGAKLEAVVDVSQTVTTVLDSGGQVAVETREALRTQGRSAVRAAMRERGIPPMRVVCSTEGCRAD